MRVSLFGLIRLTVVVGVVASTVAVGIARLQPSPSRFRLAAPPHYGVINGFVLTDVPSVPGLLDPRTGKISPCPLPKGVVLDYATCSPWQDDSGEFQVVGRWMRLEGEGSAEHCIGIGLARYALPSGRVLNRCEMDVVPSSHPCWSPDTDARVIFAGADGVLYRMDFQDELDGSSDDGRTMEPAPITWRCPPGPRVVVRDPVWPTEPRLKGRMIVSLSIGGSPQASAIPVTRLWWLELSRDFSSIVAAGPLAVDDAAKTTKEDQDERFPNLASTPDGSLVLSYLAKSQQSNDGTLRAAYLTVTPSGDTERATASSSPRIVPGSCRTLTLNHRAELCPFSADGRWIFGVVSEHGQSPRVVRYSTALGKKRDRPRSG